MVLTKNKRSLTLVECPRDAMQGWPHFIPTETKISYLQSLLAVGFHTLDAGSFVSPKAIPQMADTKAVIDGLELGKTKTKLLAIVANERGAADAVQLDKVSYLGFPFSVSATFQQRNTNSTQEESLQRIDAIQELCIRHSKTLVVYLSMGFGNPYGDPYDANTLLKWANELAARGIKILSLADTVGVASPAQISAALEALIPAYPQIEIGVHLHSSHANWSDKLAAAVESGCTRFDGALKGIGGCPMAQDDLVGNMDTALMIDWFNKKNIHTGIDLEALNKSMQLTDTVFI